MKRPRLNEAIRGFFGALAAARSELQVLAGALVAVAVIATWSPRVALLCAAIAVSADGLYKRRRQ